jgi:hypothetical protein
MIMENTKNIIDIFLMLIFTAHIFIAQKIIAQNVGIVSKILAKIPH